MEPIEHHQSVLQEPPDPVQVDRLAGSFALDEVGPEVEPAFFLGELEIDDLLPRAP